MDVSLAQDLKASEPMTVTGLPLINCGISNTPVAVVLQSVIVTDDSVSE
jgi:hypothetical protein